MARRARSRLDPAAEAAYLAELLEAAARGLHRRRHKRHVTAGTSAIAKILSGYFRRQGAAVLDAIKPKISIELAMIPRPLAEASSNGKRFAGNLLPSSVSPLRFAVTSAENAEYAAAIEAAMKGAAATLSKEAGIAASLPEDFASRYLRDNSLTKLTGNFSAESVSQLRNAIADAWDKGGSYDQIVGAVKDTFDRFSDVRAGMIAQTEAVDAYNAARDATARSAGLDEKAWETESGNPCSTCIENENDGWIGIDENFSSGDDGPTAHPNCQCVLNFRSTGAGDEG